MKKKFTWIDIGIILVVVISVIGIGSKFSTANVAGPLENAEGDIYITFYIEEIQDFVIDAISISDPVTESIQSANFGQVVEVNPGPSIFWESDDYGQLKGSPREGYSSLTLKMKTSGVISGSGISIDKSQYYVGQTVTIYAGNSMLKDGRISGAQPVQ